MDWSWEHLTAFVEEQWWVILIAAIILIIVIKVVKALVKWLIVAAILVGLFLYGMNYEPIREVMDSVAETSLDTAFELMTGEAEEATYTVNDDGTYTVESKSIKVTGTMESDKVKVYLLGLEVAEINLTDTIKAYIEAARGRTE